MIIVPCGGIQFHTRNSGVISHDQLNDRSSGSDGKQQCKPDSHNFIAIFRGFMQQDPLALEEMKRVGFVMNRMSYNGLIDLLLRSIF